MNRVGIEARMEADNPEVHETGESKTEPWGCQPRGAGRAGVGETE